MSYDILLFLSEQWANGGQEIKKISHGGKIFRRFVSLIDKDKGPIPESLKRIVRGTCLIGIVQIPFSLKRIYVADFWKTPSLYNMYRCVSKISGLFQRITQIACCLKAINVLSEDYLKRAKPICVTAKIIFAILDSGAMIQKIMIYYNQKREKNVVSEKTLEEKIKSDYYWIVLLKSSGRIVKHFFKMPNLGDALATSASAVCLYHSQRIQNIIKKK